MIFCQVSCLFTFSCLFIQFPTLRYLQIWPFWRSTKFFRIKIMNFGDVSCLFTFSCLFTLDPNSAIIADMTLLLQYKVTRYEKLWFLVMSAVCLLSAVSHPKFTLLYLQIWPRWGSTKFSDKKNLWFLAESDQTIWDHYLSSRVYRAIALLFIRLPSPFFLAT